MDLGSLFLVLPFFFVLLALFDHLFSKRKRKSQNSRLRTLSADQPIPQQILTAVGHLGVNRLLLDRFGLRARLEPLLQRAGNPYAWKGEEMVALKEIGVLLMGLLVVGLETQDAMLIGLLLLVGFFLPDLWLRSLGETRKSDLQRQLPVYVDLLSLALESGLDLMVATERIEDKMKKGPMRQELQSMIQEYRLGTSRKDVLQHWAQKVGLSDAQSLASLVIQSDEIGGDLPTVLRGYAEDMRTRRFLRAEELAGKIPVKILFPLVAFFFPIVFVIIMGPFAMEFISNTK